MVNWKGKFQYLKMKKKVSTLRVLESSEMLRWWLLFRNVLNFDARFEGNCWLLILWKIWSRFSYLSLKKYPLTTNSDVYESQLLYIIFIKKTISNNKIFKRISNKTKSMIKNSLQSCALITQLIKKYLWSQSSDTFIIEAFHPRQATNITNS